VAVAKGTTHTQHTATRSRSSRLTGDEPSTRLDGLVGGGEGGGEGDCNILNTVLYTNTTSSHLQETYVTDAPSRVEAKLGACLVGSAYVAEKEAVCMLSTS
jgi:hypothetical protein